MTTRKPLILIDGSSYLYRAFHAMPPLTNSKGQPTGAIYGVVNMLKSLIKEYQPEHIAVVFDAKGKTFRDDLYKAYKATRPPMPDDLRLQIEPLHKIVRAMGLPLLIIDGVEADDVIGTLAVQASALKMPVLISTGDKDMAQLVNDHVTLVNTMTVTQMDFAGVVEKFGVPPERIVDYLALIGDKVDNVPGVDKCGPKTAVKWLAEYDSLEGVMAHADEIKGKVGENLRAALPSLPLSKQLVTIKTDVQLPLAPNELCPAAADNDALINLYSELEFKSWLKQSLENDQSATPQAKVATNYQCIRKQKELDKWLEKLNTAKLTAFDTETTSLNFMEAELVGVSLATEANEAAYIPLAHDYEGVPAQLSRDEVLAQLKPWLESAEHKKVGQHLKYDLNVLANYDIHLNGIEFDTMLESYCLNSVANRHDMDTLALKYLGRSTIHFEDVAGKGAKQVTFDKVKLAEATDYAAEDADVTLQLHETLWPLLSKEHGPCHVFQQLEIPLIPVLAKMERTGVLVDTEKLAKISIDLGQRIDALQEKAYQLAGETFNLDSPKQLQEILYEKLGLPVVKKTPKGQPSTAEPVLRELALDYPLPEMLMEYRSLSKLKTTYADKLPQMVNAKTKRIHTSYNQTVASTGRLSSSDPNLQNIPIRSVEGRAIRSAFIAAKGYKLVSADYSQIELRIMADLSQDKSLLTAFAQGLDIHKATAAEVSGVTIDNVTDDMRRKAKAINFGLIYGMSAFGLVKQIGTGRNEAQEYIDIYFHRYPGVKAYMEKMRAKGREQGYVETLLGRRLYLPEINSKNKMRQMAAERVAINAPMQGTAADIIKQAMLDVEQWLTQSQLDARLLLQVHDELIIEAAEHDVATVEKKLPEIMQNAAKLSVPLIASVGVGDNWDEAH
jgi:DNA polymerase-1